ncbi:hypothetical protein KO516_14320, partial [Citreicella sp. C3M06]|uniref:hypothetical protein n=1 Tax=Citreicella sp. C3M06 TaxID=2841564 RepID=UPI001C087675
CGSHPHKNFVPAFELASVPVAAGPRFFFAHLPAESEPTRFDCTGFVQDALDTAPKTTGKSCKKLQDAHAQDV